MSCGKDKLQQDKKFSKFIKGPIVIIADEGYSITVHNKNLCC